PKRKAKEWKKVEETVYCIADSTGRVLLRKREKGEWRAGLWDLPEHLPDAGVGEYVEVGELKSRYVVTNHKIERTTRVFAHEGSFNDLRGPVRWNAAERTVAGASAGADAKPAYVTVDLRRSPLPVAI